MERSIEAKMVAWLDKRLKDNGLAQQAIQNKQPRVLLGLAADVCVGIREVGGNNRGPVVELIQRTIGGADREPWCMSFVQTLVAYCEEKTGVKSPLFASEHCMTVWNRTPKSMRVKNFPAANAVAIWNYPPGASGHTGIVRVYGLKNNRMNLVEGNTEAGMNNGVIERDGGGVYWTDRPTAGTAKMRLVGFLRPF